MTETVVAYHVEDEVGRPAINVKDHNAGMDYQYAAQRLMGPRDYEHDRNLEIACERITSDFWMEAEQIAQQKGLGEIEQQGRSGGWLVFTSPDAVRLESAWSEPRERAEWAAGWLAGYRSMVEWADAWIADAPRKVAALAQQLAMDEAGEEPARRMFAFRPSIGAAMWAYNGGAPKEVMA